MTGSISIQAVFPEKKAPVYSDILVPSAVRPVKVFHESMDAYAPTHLFLQAGVGSMASSVLGYYANVLKENIPATYILEPDRADCMYRSALAGDGRPRRVSGALDTLMAGLACGEPPPLPGKF